MASMREILVKFGLRDEITKPAGDATDKLGEITKELQGYGKTLEFWDGILVDKLAKHLRDAMSVTIESASQYENSWKALNYTAAEVGLTHDQLSESISEVTKQTNLGAGASRDFYQTMLNYGVTNTDLMQDSLISLYGQAAITGHTVNDVEDAIKNLVNTGRLMPRSLDKTGLNLSDMAKEFGVTTDELKKAFKDMSPEERLQVMNAAMGDTTEGVKMMNSSLEGTKMAFDRNVAGMETALGQAILPAAKLLNLVLSVVTEGLKDFLNFPGANIATSAIMTLVTAYISLIAYVKLASYYANLWNDIQKVQKVLLSSNIPGVAKFAKAFDKLSLSFIKANWELIAVCMTILVLVYALDRLFDLGIFENVSSFLHGGLDPVEEVYSGGSKSAIEGTNPIYAASEPLPEPSYYGNNTGGTTNIYVQEGAFGIDARNKTPKECKQDIITGLNELNDSERINFNRNVQNDEDPYGAV